jgi:hypothetical protein
VNAADQARMLVSGRIAATIHLAALHGIVKEKHGDFNDVNLSTAWSKLAELASATSRKKEQRSRGNREHMQNTVQLLLARYPGAEESPSPSSPSSPPSPPSSPPPSSSPALVAAGVGAKTTTWAKAEPRAASTVVVSERLAARHARRVYVGGVPASASRASVAAFFSDALRLLEVPEVAGSNPGAGAQPAPGEPVVSSVYLNRTKKYAFVEFRTVEQCSNALVGLYGCTAVASS